MKKTITILLMFTCTLFANAVNVEYKGADLRTINEQISSDAFTTVGLNAFQLINTPMSEWGNYEWSDNVGRVKRFAPSGVQLPSDIDKNLQYEIMSSLVGEKRTKEIQYYAARQSDAQVLGSQTRNDIFALQAPRVVMTSMPSMTKMGTASASFLRPLETNYGMQVRRVSGPGGGGGLFEDDPAPLSDALPLLLLLIVGYAAIAVYRKKQQKVTC